ncbi:MAG: hypothetical protein ACRCXT_17875 [Paraclostridium sp.]
MNPVVYTKNFAEGVNYVHRMERELLPNLEKFMMSTKFQDGANAGVQIGTIEDFFRQNGQLQD